MGGRLQITGMLVAVSAAHGRHALTEMWAEHTVSLGFDAVVVCLNGNKERLECHDVQNLCTCLAYDFTEVRQPNNPLAGKFNAALAQAMALGATRVMILPSDDFVSPEWVKAARETEGDYLIPHTCAIVQPPEKAYCFTKLTFGTLKFGAGRVVSRKAIEACGGELWPAELNRGLDTASHQRLRQHGIEHKIVETSTIPIADVKTPENIWPYRTWEGVGTRDVTFDDALHMVTPELRDKIKAL